MHVLMASASGPVLSRWQALLGEGNQIRQAGTVQELKGSASSGSFDLIMLHRDLVDAATCAELHALAPASRLFLLSDRPDPEEGLAFLKFGIVGYANSYISQERLLEALRVIANDGVWLGQQVIQQLIVEMAASRGAQRGGAAEQLLTALSPMERRVAELVACGRTNLEIAAELGIVERTVKAHLTSVYGKLQIGNRLSLALLLQR